MTGSTSSPYSERELTPQGQHPEQDTPEDLGLNQYDQGKKSICNILTIKK